MSYDKRKHPRREFRHNAFLRNGNGSELRDCAVNDISEGGARLEFYTRGQENIEVEKILPQRFVLSMTENNSVVRFCERVWAKGNELGVRFLNGSGEKKSG